MRTQLRLANPILFAILVACGLATNALSMQHEPSPAEKAVDGASFIALCKSLDLNRAKYEVVRECLLCPAGADTGAFIEELTKVLTDMTEGQADFGVRIDALFDQIWSIARDLAVPGSQEPPKSSGEATGTASSAPSPRVPWERYTAKESYAFTPTVRLQVAYSQNGDLTARRVEGDERLTYSRDQNMLILNRGLSPVLFYQPPQMLVPFPITQQAQHRWQASSWTVASERDGVRALTARGEGDVVAFALVRLSPVPSPLAFCRKRSAKEWVACVLEWEPTLDSGSADSSRINFPSKWTQVRFEKDQEIELTRWSISQLSTRVDESDLRIKAKDGAWLQDGRGGGGPIKFDPRDIGKWPESVQRAVKFGP